jgi:hypothetical protein
MHVTQSFLVGVFPSFVLLTVLIFLGQALAEEVTIYDNNRGHPIFPLSRKKLSF